MITPTIGRRVWFRPSAALIESSGMTVHDKAVPLDAGIIYVWNDRLVNLDVTDHAGAHLAITSVPLIHGDEPAGPMPFFYAEWMPYQNGQAKKTEAASLGEGVDMLLGARIPILEQITDLCYAIEKCGASPELTDAVTRASALRDPISELVRQALALGIGAGIVSVNVSPQQSPAATDSAIEREIQAKGLTAPRVTPARIAELMSRIVYTFDVRPNGSTATLAHAFLDGEFYLATGMSACVSVENFDADIGMQNATDNAKSPLRTSCGSLRGIC